MSYQIGHLQYPEKDDATFDDYFRAVSKAQDGSIDDSIWAVWEILDNGNADIQSIIYEGIEYSK